MNISNTNILSIDLKQQDSVKFKFGFGTTNISLNKLDALRYIELNPINNLEISSFDLFRKLVGEESEKVEYVILMLLFFQYAQYKNKDLLVNLTLLHSDNKDNYLGFFPHYDVKITSFDQQSIFFEKNNKKFNILFDDVDSFEVVNTNINEELELFLRTKHHLLLTIHGFDKFLILLIDKVINKQTVIHFKNKNNNRFSGQFFIITDGELYLKNIHHETEFGGGGPRCPDIKKIGLEEIKIIEIKN